MLGYGPKRFSSYTSRIGELSGEGKIPRVKAPRSCDIRKATGDATEDQKIEYLGAKRKAMRVVVGYKREG
jgi:hypothetical protein